MAKRGDMARQAAMDTIVKAFGDNFVTIDNKKIYVNVKEGNELIQFSIALTMPKTPIEGNSGAFNVENGVKVAPTPVELSAEDAAHVEELKRRLGISAF